jgi:hypothetical protein
LCPRLCPSASWRPRRACGLLLAVASRHNGIPAVHTLSLVAGELHGC